MLGEAYWREFRLGIILCQRLLSPVVIGGIVYTRFLQVILNRLAALLQVQLQYFKFFFRHNTITVVVVCTIADAKVQRNYNCYNVYFNECLRFMGIGSAIKVAGFGIKKYLLNKQNKLFWYESK